MMAQSENMMWAGVFHKRHADGMREQVERVRRSWFARLKLRLFFGCPPEFYIDLMRTYVVAYDLQHEFEQRVSSLQWKLLYEARQCDASKNVKARRIHLREMSAIERDIESARQNRRAVERGMRMAERKLDRFGLSPSKVD